MAKETKTIQLYPDDNIINEAMAIYGDFGWEVISNQIMQKFDGSDSDGSKNYSTFNKLTFSREKSAPWYSQVVELERQYYAEQDKIETIIAQQPAKPTLNPAWWILPFTIFCFISFSKANKKYKADFEEWSTKKAEIVETSTKKQQELREQSSALLIG